MEFADVGGGGGVTGRLLGKNDSGIAHVSLPLCTLLFAPYLQKGMTGGGGFA